jgi:CMP-N-acetylneuraminic acid synthetase
LYLQPTSPLRRAQDIENALDFLEQDQGIDTIVSVVQVPHNMTPDSLMTLEKDRLSFTVPPAQKNFRRQEKPVLYARNGPAILLSRTKIYEGGQLYGDAIAPLVMPALASIDIDTEEELHLAEMLMS